MTCMHERPLPPMQSRMISLLSFSFLFSLCVGFLLERPGQSVCVRLMGDARTYVDTSTRNKED